MTPLILGCPQSGGLDALRSVRAVTGGPVTLAWSDRAAVESAVFEVMEVGGSTLIVDTAEPAFAASAIAHQLQVMGPPAFIAVVVEDDSYAGDLAALATTTLTGMPPTAVLVVGPPMVARVMHDVMRDLELADPLTISMAELPAVAQELVTSASWEIA